MLAQKETPGVQTAQLHYILNFHGVQNNTYIGVGFNVCANNFTRQHKQ